MTIIGAGAFSGCRGITAAYFEGNAPHESNYLTTWKAFDSCAEGFNIYYLEDKTGWTTPTWKGYPCYPVNEIPGEEPEPEPSEAVQTIFGRFTGHEKDIYTVTAIYIDGEKYLVKDSYREQVQVYPVCYLDWYLLADLDEKGEVVGVHWMSGWTATLTGFDAEKGIVSTAGNNMALPILERALPIGSYKVSEMTADSFPKAEITGWIGDQIKLYTNEETVYKVIHVSYGQGKLTALNQSGGHGAVTIDGNVYNLPEGTGDTSLDEMYLDPLIARAESNIDRTVYYILYDNTLTDIAGVNDIMKGMRIELSIRNEELHRTEPANNVTGYFDVYVGNEINTDTVERFKIDVNELKSNPLYSVYLKTLELKPENPDQLHLDGKDSYVVELGDTPTLLRAGESRAFHMIQYKLTLKNDGDSVALTGKAYDIYGKKTESSKRFVYEKVKVKKDTKAQSTSENTGSEDKEELKKLLTNSEKKSLNVTNVLSWNQLFESEFLSKAQAEQIKYAILTDIAATSLPSSTFKEFVAEKVLDKFGKFKKQEVIADMLDVTIRFRIDTPKYGQLEIDINYSGPSFANSDLYFGSTGPLTYKVVGGTGFEKVPVSNRKGNAGVFAQVNLKNFTDSVKKIVKKELENAILGEDHEAIKKIKDFTKFADVVWGDTAIDMIFILYDNIDDIKKAGWEILTYPLLEVVYKCPVDIYMYDTDYNLCAYIQDEEAISFSEDIEVSADDSGKRFLFGSENQYIFKVIPSADGAMEVTVNEMSGAEHIMRTINYEDISLTCGEALTSVADFIPLSDEIYTIYDNNDQKIAADEVLEFMTELSEIRGDINADGTVDSNDAIYLLRHTMNASRYPITQSGDMNGDGTVDSNDAIYLLRHTMNPTRYPLGE